MKFGFNFFHLITMPVLLNQLVYTSFSEVGFRAISSIQVPTQIQQAFIQQVVYKYWDSYDPPRSGYRAAYVHQVSPEHTLFGWMYNDGHDDLGRSHVPYFVCYYLAELLDAVQLENIFTCLHKGPVALIDRENLPIDLEAVVAPDLWSYQPARIGVAIASGVRERSQVALKQKRLLEILITLDEWEILIELSEQIEKQQSVPLQPSLTPHSGGAAATPEPQAPSSGQDTIPAFPGNLSKPLLGDNTSNATHPTSPNRSALLTGMVIGIATALILAAAVPLMVVGSYYFYEHQLPRVKSNSGSR